MLNNYTTITTAVIYTYYTTYCPEETTFTVGSNIITTKGKVTIKDHGMFTLTHTNTMDSSDIAKSKSILSKALAAASSVSAASIYSEEKKHNASLSAQNHKSSTYATTTQDSDSSEETGSSSTTATVSVASHNGANGVIGGNSGYLTGASFAGALAIAACLL